MDVRFDYEGEIFAMSKRAAEIFAEKLRLFPRGDYPRDVEGLAAGGYGRGWLTEARAVADEIETRLVNESAQAIELKGRRAEAVYQVLRYTYFDRFDAPGMAALFEALDRDHALAPSL